MTQTFKGWAVGLVRGTERYFLGRYRTGEGAWYATTYHNPCEWYVYANLFDTADEALKFWETCNYEEYEGKDSFKAVPIQIELSVEVKGLGFDWNGIKNGHK